jgi:hypothetical protein
MYLTAIPRVTTHTRGSGTGTVIFGDAPHYERFTWLTRSDDSSTGVGFYNLRDAQTTAELVETVRERYAHESAARRVASPPTKTQGDSA